jgi:hypothetical protein
VIREGVVIYPRRSLEAWLEAAQVPYRRKELTQAIESLGGGPRGVMHFPGAGKIRVWFAPILARG